MRTLDKLKPGESGVVAALHGTGAIQQRLLEMGVIEGTEVSLIRLAPLGDLGSPIDLARVFGGGDGLRAQLERVQSWLYAA